MKKKILLIFFPLTVVCFYYFKLSRRPQAKPETVANNSKATITKDTQKYLMHRKKINDTCWQVDTYRINGPLVNTLQFRNEFDSILHGEAVYYNKKGTRDSIGHFYKGIPNGMFVYFDSTKKFSKDKQFLMGMLITNVEKNKIKAGKQEEISFTDYGEISDAYFPGGNKAWQTYITKNLQYPEKAIDSNIEGTVCIQFSIDQKGHAVDLAIVQSADYSLDREALRIIKKSPAWKPSVRYNGKKIVSYKIQPVIFRLKR